MSRADQLLAAILRTQFKPVAQRTPAERRLWHAYDDTSLSQARRQAAMHLLIRHNTARDARLVDITTADLAAELDRRHACPAFV